jgi:hypothetical protein
LISVGTTKKLSTTEGTDDDSYGDRLAFANGARTTFARALAQDLLGTAEMAIEI